MENITAPEKHSILVIGAFTWGKANNLKTALANARKNNDVKINNMIVAVVPHECQVDDMGHYYFHKDCNICKVILHQGETPK